MTGRTCPVHGEYSASGACRWCEPAPAPLPDGHARCRCGWIGWTPDARKPFREEHRGVVHTPEQCYATAATPPAEPPTYMGAPVVVDPSASGDAVPILVSWTVEEETPDAYVFRLEWTKAASEAIAAGVNKASEARLAKEHAALRWERVARRWGNKRRPVWLVMTWFPKEWP